MSDPAVVDSDDRALPSLLGSAVLALVLGALAAIMFASHRAGHWWGDDWALYVRQAQGLLDGHPARVIEENRFAVDNSLGAAFSPPLYPWGFPIILAPFIAVLGDDLDRLAVVPVLCAMGFAWAWYALARPRLGTVAALVGVVAVTITPLLLGWTELIQSEWPFLAVTGGVLVALDRLSARNAFVDTSASIWPIVLIGVGAASAFSVRREGLAVIGAITAAQLAAVIGLDRSWWTERVRRATLVLRLVAPHLTALATIGLLQVVLPSTLVPQYTGTSVRNVWRFRRDHLDHLAEVSGLKRSYESAPEVLGSATIGWIAVVAYLVAALAGTVLAIVVFRRRDLHLVAYAAGALVIGGSFRAPINRYVCTIAPILLLLGATAIAAAARLTPWRHTATIVVSLLLATLATGNVVQARTRIESAELAAESGSIEWGPTHPLAVEMFDAVTDLSEPTDIIAAPKARAMTWATGRLAVQVDEYRRIPESVPIALVVADSGGKIATELADVDSGYRQVWANSRFVIFEPSIPAP